MARAFLSHSSEDKAYVDIVARRLSRSRVMYDRQNFEPGEDFRDSIKRGLDDSEVFVLFASARSLASNWVKFEIDEAETRRIAGKLKTALVVVIDRTIKPSDLPSWMQKALFCPQTRASQAARLILARLLQYEGAGHQALFMGREDLLRDVAGQMPPPAGASTPQILVFSGLEGVGRRSVARRALKDNLSLTFGPVIFLEETDAVDKIYLQLLEDRSPFSSRDEYTKAAKEFHAAAPAQQAKLIAKEIDSIAKDNAATLIVDQGSLIEESGMFTASAAGMFAEVVALPSEPYVVVIQRRRPPIAQTTSASRIASFAVPPLSLDATRRLLVQTLKVALGKVPSDNDAEDLANYLDGYPPAVQLAAAYAKRYGLDALMADKSALIDLKVKTFDRVLTKLNLDSTDQMLLRVLGMEPGLSLDVLTTIMSAPVTDLVPRITRLIDHSVVVRYDDTLSLASPMRDSVYREFGIFTSAEYSTFAKRLKDRFWTEPGTIPALDAIDATLYTAGRAHAKDLEEFADIVAPSMFLKIANAAYHERDYKAARDFAQRAIDADPNPDRGWVILAKAYVRLAHEGAADWSKAESIVGQLKKRGHRLHYYLAGFLSWKRGDLRSAVKHFTQAEQAGDRNVAVYRDRAHCKYQLGLVDEALADIKVALDKYPRNPFSIDLAAAIAIRGGNYSIAEQFLRDLAEVEPKKENYHHRLATLYAARGRFDKALEESELAAKRNPPLHEILANRIDILIELKRYPDALHELDKLEQQFKGKVAKDVQTGLRCKIALRQGNWEEAHAIFYRLHNKELPVHKSLMAEILRQKARDSSVSVDEQQLARQEADGLAKELKAIGAAFSFISENEEADI